MEKRSPYAEDSSMFRSLTGPDDTEHETLRGARHLGHVPSPRSPMETMMRFKPLIAGTAAALFIGTVGLLTAGPALAAPTRFEAENSPAVCTGTIDNNWAGFSGTGFCNGTNAVGAFAQFT